MLSPEKAPLEFLKNNTETFLYSGSYVAFYRRYKTKLEVRSRG
jgi:hypothetical protein